MLCRKIPVPVFLNSFKYLDQIGKHCGDPYEYDCSSVKNGSDEDHKEAACTNVSKGAVPRTSAKAFTSRASKPENAEPFEALDDLKYLDSTSTKKPDDKFDFPSLDLDLPLLTSEDHTKILVQADNLLKVTKLQLLDMQRGIAFEEKQINVQNQPSIPFSSDGKKQQRRELIGAAVQGSELKFKTHRLSRPSSSIKQNKPTLADSEECKRKKKIQIQDNIKKNPTRQPFVINEHPTNIDIQKEIRISQDSLQGALTEAKAISAILEVKTGRDGKDIQLCNSGFEKFKNIRSQVGQNTQFQNANGVDLHLSSQINNIPEPGGELQSMTKDKIVLRNKADLPDCSLNYDRHSSRTPVPSNVCACTKLTHESQTQNDHSQPCSRDREHRLEYAESQVKRPQRKLRSEDARAFKNTDTKVLKSALKNYSSSGQHEDIHNCAKKKMHVSPCNSAVVHMKASIPTEKNLEKTDPQPERRLVVQALPSLTIRRDLSVQKVPSISLPSAGAPPFVPPQQNVGLCEISHSQVQLGQTDCTSKTQGDRRSSDKHVLKSNPKLQDGYRQHIHHGQTSGTALKDETKKHSILEQRSSRGLRASSVSDKRSRMTDASPKKLLSQKEYHSLCRRCRNSYLLTDLYRGVCVKCHNIPSPSREVKQHLCGPTPDVAKAAARLDRCKTCLRHFPKSELFHGHCVQCQIVKNNMRLFQCNICLNSVPSTEYVNGKCNRCHYRFKYDTQKDEVDAYSLLQGPAVDRILNSVLDETPFFLDMNKAKYVDGSPTGESISIKKNEETDALFRATKMGTKRYTVQEETMKTQDFIANDRTRKNSLNDCKAHLATEEYLKDNDNNKKNRSIKTFVEGSKQNNKQEVMFHNFESDDECEFRTKIRAASKSQETSYDGSPEAERLSSSSGLRDYDEDISNGSNRSSQMETQAVYNRSKKYDGGNANGDVDSYEQDFESEYKSSDAELKISNDNVKYCTDEQETQAHVHKEAEVKISVQDFPKRNPKRVSKTLGTRSPIMGNSRHHHFDMSNRSNSDPDKVSQLDNKILELGDETDESCNKIYNDKPYDTSESVSDTNLKADNGSRKKRLEHDNISKVLPNRNKHDDHIESYQAAGKPKYSSSKSDPHAATSRNVDCSYKHSFRNWQGRAELNSDSGIGNRRHDVSDRHQQCFDDNYNRRKHVQTLKTSSGSSTTTIPKKTAACRNRPKDHNDGKRQLKLMTMVEGEHITGAIGKAEEENDDIRSVPTESSSTDSKDRQMLLVDDSRSVNEDDIYEDDWEEELKDSEEEGRSRNDKEEEPSENISHVSSRDAEETSRADSEAVLSQDSSEHSQKHSYHSPSARVMNPYVTVPRETTSPVALTPPVCLAKVSSKEYFQKPMCVDHETSPINIPYLKCLDKGSSPISIPGKIPVSREVSSTSILPVEHVHKGSSSFSVSDKEHVNRQTSPMIIPSELPMDKASSPIEIPSVEHNDKGLLSAGIQTENLEETHIRILSGTPVDKSTSPISFPPQKLALPACNNDLSDVCTHGAEVGDSLHGLPLCKEKSARGTPNMRSIGQQTTLFEQTETQYDTLNTHSEEPQCSHIRIEPVDTACHIKGIDIETQTDAILEDAGHHDKMEKIRNKKHRGLVCVQSQQDDEPSSSSTSQQDVSVQHEVVPRTLSLSSPHENTTETTSTSASVSNEQISPSDGELLVSCSSCSVGELFVSGVHDRHFSPSCHTNSHSVGEVWKCQWFGTHCLCSKEEVAVDSTLHKGQHVSWIRHASKTQIVNGIVVHSGASVKDDFDSSEETNNSMPSFSIAQIDTEVRHTRRNLGPYDHSRVGCNSHSEGELSEGQVMTWHH